jgi:6-pyruvoyl-tetrahydropterin synthase
MENLKPLFYKGLCLEPLLIVEGPEQKGVALTKLIFSPRLCFRFGVCEDKAHDAVLAQFQDEFLNEFHKKSQVFFHKTKKKHNISSLGLKTTKELICIELFHWVNDWLELKTKAVFLKSLSFSEAGTTYTIEDSQFEKPLAEQVMEVSRKIKLSCVHSHENNLLSVEENQSLFKKCSQLHGHEYTLSFTLQGSLNLDTFTVIGDKAFADKLSTSVQGPFNNSFLNEVVNNTTGENISFYFYEQIKDSWPEGVTLQEVAAKETFKNQFFTTNKTF